MIQRISRLPGQVRSPARPLAAPKATDPFMGPGLSAFGRVQITHRRQIVKPGETVQFGLEGVVRHRQVPDRTARGLHQISREQEVAAGDLAAAREGSDGAAALASR